MIISARGIALIEQFEGLRLSAYPDPQTGGAPWSIGFGHTGPDVHQGMTCTKAQAQTWLQQQLASFENIVRGAVHVPLNQNQFDAMVSIVYNVGPGSSKRDGIIRLKSGSPSTLLRLLNAKNYAGAADQFLVWCSPGSKDEGGLSRRRQAEKALFESPVNNGVV